MMPFFSNLSELIVETEHTISWQFNLQKLVVWIRKECKKIEKLQQASIPYMKLDYSIKIRKPQPKKVVKQLVKKILKTKRFNQLHYAKHIVPEPNRNKNDVLDKQRYELDFRWNLSNGCIISRFTVDLDPLTLGDDESIKLNNN
ncbi:hypothetical protein M3Y96_00234300 [Aphelenchoides besseyi]|nr:hypothetical protein M3Y96_00234300 [Aphelenchoides besseyi]